MWAKFETSRLPANLSFVAGFGERGIPRLAGDIICGWRRAGGEGLWEPGDRYVSLYNCGQALVNVNPFLLLFFTL